MISYDFMRGERVNSGKTNYNNNNSDAIYTMFSDLARITEEQSNMLVKEKHKSMQQNKTDHPKTSESSVVNVKKENPSNNEPSINNLPNNNQLKFLNPKSESIQIERFGRQVRRYNDIDVI